MINGLDNLASMEYPGRFIAMGMNEAGFPTVVYGITGRSPSSQARRLVEKDNTISVEPTDIDLVNQGDPSLLIYPAIIIDNLGVGVSNGAQTPFIRLIRSSEAGLAYIPAAALISAHRNWEHEPDAPNFTPRISGYMPTFSGDPALAIIKRSVEGVSERHCFEVPMLPGIGRLISTYTGVNQDPLPSFSGSPLPIRIVGNSTEDIAQRFYSALERTDGKDFRVSVAAVSAGREYQYTKTIINRHK
ncbi:MAG: IMP cyclohydrolase [Nanoarchaeota archaeon]